MTDSPNVDRMWEVMLNGEPEPNRLNAAIWFARIAVWTCEALSYLAT